MGFYENIVKIKEMRRRVDEGDYEAAQKILDIIPLKKIKNTSDLNIIAQVYKENGRYEEAMEILLKLYQKRKTRKVIFQLVLLSIKMLHIEDAEKYLAEYKTMAPKDFYNYIFRYKIDKIKGESYEVLIDTLVALKNREYIEKWAYELAKLYYKAGMEEECINECSDIILWFGEGSYVEKAKMLKAYYSGETNKEKMIEELKRRAKEKQKVESTEGSEETADIDSYQQGSSIPETEW
ncbi:MAG: hypothetical protein GX306_06900 [Clostridiales bacterium]|jgi:tetratricopeptide (TPR) repeat protein|nr:hypothetical protein [Clostridiales bacterium]